MHLRPNEDTHSQPNAKCPFQTALGDQPGKEERGKEREREKGGREGRDFLLLTGWTLQSVTLAPYNVISVETFPDRAREKSACSTRS